MKGKKKEREKKLKQSLHIAEAQERVQGQTPIYNMDNKKEFFP